MILKIIKSIYIEEWVNFHLCKKIIFVIKGWMSFLMTNDFICHCK